MALLKSFLHFESMEGGGGEARAALWLESKGFFPAVASAARTMQVPCHLCFVGESGGGKPGGPPAPNPTSTDTSGKPVSWEEEKMAGIGWPATLPRYLLAYLPPGGKGWK